MSTIIPSTIPLTLTNLTGKRSMIVVINGIRKRYKIDKETQQRTDVVDGLTVDMLARNGVQSVKLPVEAVDETTFTQIDEAIKAEKIVKVNFGATASTLRGKFYALINKSTGQLVQGISCTASELNLVSIDEPELDDIDEDFINL